MIKIFKGNIIIGDPTFIKLEDLEDNMISSTGFNTGEGVIHWAPESVTDLKFYKKQLVEALDQELGDFKIESGFLCVGLLKENIRPKNSNKIIYLTNYDGPIEIWSDKQEIPHVLGYGNIRFYSQWKS